LVLDESLHLSEYSLQAPTEKFQLDKQTTVDMSKVMDAAFWDFSEIAVNKLAPHTSWGSVPLGTWLNTPSFETLEATEQGEEQGEKYKPDEKLFEESITAQGHHKKRWCMLPSVGSWIIMQPFFEVAKEKPIAVVEPAVDEAELSMREAAFDFFWAQFDQEEEDEKAFHMESELSLRQAAFDFFWAQVDQEEEDERAFLMESELSLRQAAFDFFWAQVDQEEEDERALFMESELSLRQAAFDFFWAQLDQEEEDERACFLESELSLRQAAFDFFWVQVDQEEEDERAFYMESELLLRQAAFDFLWAQIDQAEEMLETEKHAQDLSANIGNQTSGVQSFPAKSFGHQSVPQVWPTFSMAGSPAKSIRRAKGLTQCHIKEPSLAFSRELFTSMQKSNHAKKRSSSTAALVLDLGQRSGQDSYQDLYSERAKSCSANKAQSFKGIGKTLVLPPLKKSSSLANLELAPGMQTPSPKFARGC